MNISIKHLVSAAALAATLGIGVAHATPLTFKVTVWSALTPNSTINSPNQQALPTNTLRNSGDLAAKFTYAGLPNWDNTAGSSNTFGTFVTQSSILTHQFFHSFSDSSVLSTSNFASTSLFELTFTTTQSLSGTITHDDGVSLWNSGNTTDFVNSSGPTNAIPTAFSVGPGTYNLWYVEANGAPAVLDMQVPEPGSLMLLGTGLIGLGVVLRRSKRSF